MKFAVAVIWSTVAASSLLPFAVHADPAVKPDTESILFEKPDWTKAPPGAKLTYDYSRKTYGSKDYGGSFDDTIALTLDSSDKPADRNVEVRMFSGERRMPAGPFEDTSTNPVLLLVFENHLQVISQLFHANPRYLKNAIRRAWRDDATIESVSLDVGGKTVPGTRITTHPFINDPMKDLMKGLDTLTYVVETSDSVPGEIVSINIHAPGDGAPKFSESLHYEAEKTP